MIRGNVRVKYPGGVNLLVAYSLCLRYRDSAIYVIEVNLPILISYKRYKL